jgi:hypothetical protein
MNSEARGSVDWVSLSNHPGCEQEMMRQDPFASLFSHPQNEKEKGKKEVGGYEVW